MSKLIFLDKLEFRIRRIFEGQGRSLLHPHASLLELAQYLRKEEAAAWNMPAIRGETIFDLCTIGLGLRWSRSLVFARCMHARPSGFCKVHDGCRSG